MIDSSETDTNKITFNVKKYIYIFIYVKYFPTLVLFKPFFMKKITLLLLLITTFISCSKSETNTEIEVETEIPQALIGTWEFKGIYVHNVFDENNMPIFNAYENNDYITFNSDKTFFQLHQNYQYTGTFTVTNNNKLNFFYDSNPNGINNNGSTKISVLTENELRLSCFQEPYCDVARYEKVPSN